MVPRKSRTPRNSNLNAIHFNWKSLLSWKKYLPSSTGNLKKFHYCLLHQIWKQKKAILCSFFSCKLNSYFINIIFHIKPQLPGVIIFFLYFFHVCPKYDFFFFCFFSRKYKNEFNFLNKLFDKVFQGFCGRTLFLLLGYMRKSTRKKLASFSISPPNHRCNLTKERKEKKKKFLCDFPQSSFAS